MKRKASVLVAEDEPQAREALRALLEDEGYRVTVAANGMEAAGILAGGAVEAALLDIRMPGKDGLTVLRELAGTKRPPAILVMTAFGTSSVAIEAMALGAFDYLTKPLHFDELLIQLKRAIDGRRQTLELEGYREEASASTAADMVGDSPAMQAVYKLIGQVAPTHSTVLIRGESGTGKELVARAIHRHSPRADRRLVVVNCASIPETLLEAELFGHERGAFTGAAQRRIGKFEYANGGTIFLDEVGELAVSTQSKLLRVLQDGGIERLGSNAEIRLDVRVLAATNRNLEEMVAGKRFREDLYYRLNVVQVVVPPLRERRTDIPQLAEFLLRRCAGRLKLAAPSITAEAAALLQSMEWRGNVRELEHCLERALILSRGGMITAESLQADAAPREADPFGQAPLEMGLHEAVRLLERRLVERALAQTQGNRTRAAEILQVNRRLLYEKIKEFGL